MATVIDSLIVKLGLDPADFTKGEKKVAAEVLKTKDVVNRANNEMGAGFTSLAKKLLVLAGGFALINKAVGGIMRMSTEIRDLGRQSRNLDISAATLRNFGSAIEALGGDAKEALGDIEKFQKSIFDLSYQGQFSAQLEMLARMGVAFQDAAGNARDFGEVAEDAGKKARDLVQGGQMTRANANFMLREAGFSEVMASAMLDGTLSAELARQQRTHKQIGPGIVAEATSIEKSRIEMRQDREDVAITTMRDTEKAFEALEAINQKFTEALMKFINWVDDNLMGGKKFDALPGGRADHFTTNTGAVNSYAAPKSSYAAPGAYAGAQQDPMKMLVKTKDGKLVPRSELNDVEAAMTAPRTGFLGWLGRKGAEAVARAEANENAGRAINLAGQASPTLGSSTRGGPTTIHVGPVTVVTQATDANGIAADMAGAVQRKTSAAQAEPGMQ